MVKRMALDSMEMRSEVKDDGSAREEEARVSAAEGVSKQGGVADVGAAVDVSGGELSGEDVSDGKVGGAEKLLAAAVKPADRIVCWTRVKSRRLVNSFYYAFAGLWFLLRTQRNARIHVGIGTLACALGVWVGIGRVEWSVLIFTIALVLILEGLNTAVEAAVDLACPGRHPLAKAAKDLAAGMVLIGAMASVGVGLMILGPGLWMKLTGR
jgi:diacylglycerol kinase